MDAHLWIWLMLGPLLAAAPAYFVIAWSTKWIRKRWARIYARIVLVPPFALVLGAFVSAPLALLLDDGDWRCLVCATEENQFSVAGMVLRRTPPETGSAYAEFEQWYWREIYRPHEHDWTSVGCHRTGLGYATSGAGLGAIYFRALPKLPSPELARGMEFKLIEASSSDRERMLIAVDDEPFRSIAWKTPMSLVEFETAFMAWLDEHPEWR